MNADVLVIAAHPDDAELGMGGTIKAMTETGMEVSVFCLGAGWDARQTGLKNPNPAASERALAILGATRYTDGYLGPDNAFDTEGVLILARRVEGAMRTLKPPVVYTHSSADLNVDHRLVHEATCVACRPPSVVKEMYAYEVPSSTEWGGRPFQPTQYIDMSEWLAEKQKAFGCYETEITESGPRSSPGLEILAAKRGMEAGLRYAEAFEVVRMVR